MKNGPEREAFGLLDQMPSRSGPFSLSVRTHVEASGVRSLDLPNQVINQSAARDPAMVAACTVCIDTCSTIRLL